MCCVLSYAKAAYHHNVSPLFWFHCTENLAVLADLPEAAAPLASQRGPGLVKASKKQVATTFVLPACWQGVFTGISSAESMSQSQASDCRQCHLGSDCTNTCCSPCRLAKGPHTLRAQSCIPGAQYINFSCASLAIPLPKPSQTKLTPALLMLLIWRNSRKNASLAIWYVFVSKLFFCLV